jgi:tRNA(fMet)-specific endonuclease VapC
MQPRFLLDTNILSDLVRRPQGKIADWIAHEGESSICTSIVVASELRFGAEKLGSARLTRQLGIILSALDILPLDEPADRHYAKLRWHLEQRGSPIGPNDLLIAAHALALDCTVVTANDREFSRVPGLKVVNWLNG